MKILMLNYEFPPLGGGSANQTYYTLKEFAKFKDLKIDLVTSSIDKYKEEQFLNNIKIYYLGIGKKGNLHYQSNKDLLKYSWKTYFFAKNLLKQNKYDLVHAFFGIPCGYIAMKLGLPYIVSLQGADVPGYSPRFNKIYFLLKGLIKNIWKNADRIIANSNDLKNLALTTSPDQKIEVIQNGVDCNKFKPDNSLKKEDTFRVLYVGRLCKIKGLKYLLDAFRKFVRRKNNVGLIIVGSGPLYRSIKKSSLEFGDNLELPGIKKQEELIGIYQKASVFVLPSLNEGMSNAILEAMASGLPIVTTDTGGTKELIRDNGIIVKKEDSESIFRALEKLYLDRDLLNKMRIASRKKAETMSWKTVAEEYHKIYQKV